MTRGAPSRVSAGIIIRTLAASLAAPFILSTVSLAGSTGISGEHAQTGNQSSEAVVLEAGTSVERSLSSGQRHTYRLALEADRYARLNVDQRGVDVSVQLRGTDGRALVEFQQAVRNDDTEPVEFVSGASGDYTFEVRPAFANQPSGSYRIRVEEIRTATAGDRSLYGARALRAEARRLMDAGKQQDARPLLERAIGIVEVLPGPAALALLAVTLVDLAEVHLIMSDVRNAEPLYLRAVALLERGRGLEDPVTAMAWSRLGVIYGQMGERARAEKLVARGLEVIERVLGPDHPLVARCLIPLVLLRTEAGDLDKAEDAARRGMAIAEKAGKTEDLDYGALVNGLGVIHLRKGEYQSADELFTRSLAIDEAHLGAESSPVAISLTNLGIIARQRKEYAKAEDYYLRALAIREKMLGPEHPDIASTLNNLANVYRDRGDVAKALATHLRVLVMREHTTGPNSPAVLVSLGNIARIHAGIGDIANAVKVQTRADAVLETQLALNLAIGSERQKLALLRSVADRTDRTISLDLSAAAEPEATALGALVLLQRKGRVLDAMTNTLAALRQRVGAPRDRELLDDLKTTTARLAGLVLNGPGDMRPDEHMKTVKTLEASKERIEAEISEHSAEFRAQSRAVTLDAVREAIPADCALVEFAVFRPFDPKAIGNSDTYGEPHYVAYVIERHGPPHRADLGSAAAIDGAVGALRQALRNPARADVKRLARAVDAKVMQPVRAWIGGSARLLISPDGELNLIPFEALIDGGGRYLVERYSVTYLTSGRDLLRLQVPRPSGSEPFILADPLFGEPAASNAVTSARGGRRSITVGEDMSSMYFARLSGTAREARAIQALFPGATLVTRDQATKSSLARLNAPRMLHIASHGFFLQREAPGTRAAASIQNPLLRSGLALAGANLKNEDDGVLTALEASTLNLWGTKLVTLSACDTGVGEVRNGEGVYGLRRAFFLAGAESLVMSLWPVSDYVTREMMTAYYAGLKRGLGRGEALRQEQLAMLGSRNRQHPFFWAGFIEAGEWANLDGRR